MYINNPKDNIFVGTATLIITRNANIVLSNIKTKLN